MPPIFRILLGILIISIVEYYFFRKISKAFKYLFPRLNRRKYKITIGIILFLLNLYPLALLVNWILGNFMDGPPIALEGAFYDFFLIFPFWIGITIVLQSVLFFILFDLLKLLLNLIVKSKESILKLEAGTIAVVTLLAVFYVPGRIYYDFYNVEFREIVITRNNLHKDLEDFRLVFITDLQADGYTKGPRLQRYIDAANNANPHLVLLAGDFITSGPKYVDTAAYYAGKLNAELGVYSCVGDHDHWIYREDPKRSLRELSSALKNNNVGLIHNQNLIFKHKSADIKVTFVTNSYVDKILMDSLLNLTGVTNENDLNIFVSHQPRNESINTAASSGYDLFLAGHTHGGQLTFLFPFIKLSPTLFETKFVHGKFSIGDMTLIVSSGLGMSLAPFRYNSTPEVILIRFKSRN